MFTAIMDQAICHVWLLTVFVALTIYFITSAIYNIYFSPLAQYPGPFLAKISGWPNFYYATTGYRHIWIWQLHEIYGEAVRFKPDGVLFNSPSAYRSIHHTKANVKRGKFYDFWTHNSQAINTLNCSDKMIHARKRRVLNAVFSEKAIRSAEDFVKRHIDRWNELLIQGNDGKEWTDPKNMSDLTDYLVFDIMGDLCFGRSFEIKEPGENPLRVMPHTIAGAIKAMYPITQSPILRLWLWLKPRGLNAIMAIAMPKVVKQYFEFVIGSVTQRRAEEDVMSKSGAEESQGRKDIFHYLFNVTDDAGNPAYSAEELNAEASLLITAGSDTTAMTLAGFFFHTLRSPRVYAKLVEEIRTTFKNVDDIQMGTALSSCKYLQACMEETMRAAPAGVSELPREVLPGGLEINGNYIPQGTHVGVSTWSIMHNQEAFGDPWIFRPERWIVDSVTGVTAEDVARAQSAFNPFSIGIYNCAGQKLAMQELLLTAARTLYRMDVRLAPGDTLGAGAPNLGWGLRDRNHMALQDAYLSLRTGPTVQFRKRT